MGFWNHRVVRRTEDDEELLSLHEAHYADGADPAGRPDTITLHPVAPYAEDIDGLRQVLDRMRAALDKPVLDYDDF